MPINRIQFQAGLSMPEFFKHFGTEAQCEVALGQSRWPQGFVKAAGGSAGFENG